MKLSILILFPLLFVSCYGPYSLKDIQAYNLKYLSGCETFQLIDGNIIFELKLDSIDTRVRLDMASSTQIITINNLHSGKKKYRKITQLPTGKDTLFYSRFSPSISNNLFEVQNSFGVEITNNNLRVCDSNLVNKIIGLPLIISNSNKNIVSISFSDSTLCFKPFLPSDLKAYTELDYTITKNLLLIELTLNGKKEKYLFDTGNDGYIIVSKISHKKEILPKPMIILEGNLFSSIKDTDFSTAKIYNNQHFEELKKINSNNIIVEYEQIFQNNLGIEFIKKFDWVFDHKNKKVYIKPSIGHSLDNITNIKKFKISIIDGQPQFTFKEANNDQIKLFIPILKINEFDFENNISCELVNLINNMDINQIKTIEYID